MKQPVSRLLFLCGLTVAGIASFTDSRITGLELILPVFLTGAALGIVSHLLIQRKLQRYAMVIALVATGMGGVGTAALALAMYSRPYESVFKPVLLVSAMGMSVAGVAIVFGELLVASGHLRVVQAARTRVACVAGSLVAGLLVFIAGILLMLPPIDAFQYLEWLGAPSLAGKGIIGIYGMAMAAGVLLLRLTASEVFWTRSVGLATMLAGVSLGIIGWATASILLIIPGGIVAGGAIREGLGFKAENRG